MKCAVLDGTGKLVSPWHARAIGRHSPAWLRLWGRACQTSGHASSEETTRGSLAWGGNQPRNVGRQLEETIQFSSWPQTKCQERQITTGTLGRKTAGMGKAAGRGGLVRSLCPRGQERAEKWL